MPWTRQRIAKRVRALLTQRTSADFGAEILIFEEEEIRKNAKGEWVVPIYPSRNSVKTYQYYDILAEVGEALDQENVNVVLVPVRPEAKLDELSEGRLTLNVGNPAYPEVTEKVTFVVDSGALYSVVPAAILKKLKIKPLLAQKFVLANGTRIHRQKGIALFRYGEGVGGADVLFGQKGDKPLLGATTLEALGLGLDPLKGRLIPLPLAL